MISTHSPDLDPSDLSGTGSDFRETDNTTLPRLSMTPRSLYMIAGPLDSLMSDRGGVNPISGQPTRSSVTRHSRFKVEIGHVSVLNLVRFRQNSRVFSGFLFI